MKLPLKIMRRSKLTKRKMKQNGYNGNNTKFALDVLKYYD